MKIVNLLSNKLGVIGSHNIFDAISHSFDLIEDWAHLTPERKKSFVHDEIWELITNSNHDQFTKDSLYDNLVGGINTYFKILEKKKRKCFCF